ncbi:hypothetical protein MAHJHV63_54420 [Mycobacterium avium subsp. hominissuis]
MYFVIRWTWKRLRRKWIGTNALLYGELARSNRREGDGELSSTPGLSHY